MTRSVRQTDARFLVPLRGTDVDAQTRCAHHRSTRDVIALRCACCETFYPCHACHEDATDRAFALWPRERADEPAVFCGVCRSTMTAREYLASPASCARCGAAFNPGCRAHHSLYFAAAEAPGETTPRAR